jgi:hypothetical protein
MTLHEISTDSRDSSDRVISTTARRQRRRTCKSTAVNQVAGPPLAEEAPPPTQCVHTQKRAQGFFVCRMIQELSSPLHTHPSSTATLRVPRGRKQSTQSFRHRHCPHSDQTGRLSAAIASSQHTTSSYEEAKVRLLYRENKERDITTALGRTMARHPQLRKRTRRRGRSPGDITLCNSRDSFARRLLEELTRENTPVRESKARCPTEYNKGGFGGSR